MVRTTYLVVAGVIGCLLCLGASAAVTVFFDSSQLSRVVDTGVTSETISSHGYLFTCTRDNLFTGGTGQVIGRRVYVPWPDGVESQAISTPPPGVTDHKARMTIQRVDGDVFDLPAFSVKVLANTAGAGAALEIMPLVDGEDAFNDPVAFDVSGYGGQVFSYDSSPNPWGSTASLKGFDTYKIALYIDFAFVDLIFENDRIPSDLNGDQYVDQGDVDAFMPCILGPSIVAGGGCELKDLDYDFDVDMSDFAIMQCCFSGANVPADPTCGG